MDYSNCTINCLQLAMIVCFDFFTETNYLVSSLCWAWVTSDSLQANSVYLAKTPTYYLHTLQYSYFVLPYFVASSEECCQSFLLSSLWSNLMEHSWSRSVNSYLLWYRAVELESQKGYRLHLGCSSCHSSDYPEICGSSIAPSLVFTDSIANLTMEYH